MDEELEMRLKALEDESRNAKTKAREDSFMDSYGSMFSGDRNLGLAIMNELDRRGIDTSAADEELQMILDELRTELQEMLGLIQQTQKQAEKEMDKIDAIADVVTDTVNSNPDATVDNTAAEMPAPEMPAPLPEMPAQEEFDPAMMEAGAAMPAPPAEGEAMPEEQPPAELPPEVPAEQPPAAEEALSDRRAKLVKRVLSDRRAKHVRKPAYKPSAAVISAASGGRF